jgi:hypothetical protein
VSLDVELALSYQTERNITTIQNDKICEKGIDDRNLQREKLFLS